MGCWGDRFAGLVPAKTAYFWGGGWCQLLAAADTAALGVVEAAEPEPRPVLAGVLGTVPGSLARSSSPLTAPYKSVSA